MVQGGELKESPPGVFDMLQHFKRFCLQLKAFDLVYEMRYISWVVVLLKVCDVTKHGGHFGCHLVFYRESEIRLKQ